MTKLIAQPENNNHRFEFCDNEGYPTSEYLDFIRNYNYKSMPIMELVSIICDNWYHGDWGYHLSRKYKGTYEFELHTLGWSGNEEVINEIIENIYLTHGMMEYYKWEAGGHYYFRIDPNRK